MVKKTFFKECLRAIRGSFSRFLAIFLIVALGAGFLAGLMATTPDMRHTVSELYHRTNLFDLRIAGNLGMEDTDAEAIAAVPGVLAVMPARAVDRELLLTIYTLTRLSQCPNIRSPILVTLSGIVMLVSLSQE